MIGIFRLRLAGEIGLCNASTIPLLRQQPGMRWARVVTIRWRR